MKKTITRIFTIIQILRITIPHIIQMYKIVYKNYIKKEEEINNKIDALIAADRAVKEIYNNG